jgi:TonB-dependent receptor
LWLNTTGEGAVRTFSTLDEKAGEARASYRLDFGPLEHTISVKTGALARGARRDANTQAFGISAPIMEDSVRALPAEVLFGGRFTAPDSSVFNIRSLAQGGSYTANDALFAGFAMADVPLSASWRLVTGARVEHSDVQVNAVSTLGQACPTERVFTDALPSVALTFRPSNGQTFRVSGSRTLARPEYRELACVRSRDVLGGVDQSGNPNLVRTLIDNADLRWEFYPRAGELLSVAAFAKRFHDPIERVSRSTSTNSFVTFVNAHAADNVGVELEARKGLDAIADVLSPLTVFSSVTIMRSQIRLGDKLGASTNANRAMVGQAPYVVNAGLTYSSASGPGSATLLYNRVGPRIVEAGELPLPDVKEKARDILDLSVRVPAGAGVVARIDAKNLLDAHYQLIQGTVTREAYRMGRTLQIGLNVQR